MTTAHPRHPRIGVVIPMFNAATIVGASIASLLAQTMTDWQAVVIDDGSTDDSAQAVHLAAGGDARIRVVKQANGGVAAARNAGLKLVRGEFVHFLDAGDPLRPDAYERLVAAAGTPGVDGATGAYDVCGTDGTRLYTRGRTNQIIDLDDLVTDGTLWTVAHIVRREAIQGMEFDASLPVYEDCDMWYRLAERGVRWAAIPEVVASYMIEPGSLSKSALTVLNCSQRSLSALYERQRALGELRRLDDASHATHERLLGEAALRYATRAVVMGGEAAIPEAEAAYAAAPGTKVITPSSAAAEARLGVMHGPGLIPQIELGVTPEWAIAVRAWWQRCEARGWGQPGLVDKAWMVLRILCVPPDRVCEALLERCHGCSAITLFGFGQNGRLLARHALGRGLRVFVRDDRFADGHAPGEVATLGVEPEAMTAPLAAGRAVVVTPLEDERLVARLPREIKAFRWRECLAGAA